MIESIQNLLLLQSLDLQIREIEKRLSEIPLEINGLERQRHDKETELDEKKNELEEQRKLQRKLEAELQDNEEKLVKYNVQLNQIKSNEEYRSMLRQIETVKFQNNEIESAILETFEDIDARKRQQIVFKKEIDQFSAQIQQAIDRLKLEETKISKNRDELKTEFDQTRSEINNSELSHYDNLINSKLSPAIVPIEGEICGGCHLTIRPKVLIEIKRNDKINYCENCFRFLYWKEVVNSPQA